MGPVWGSPGARNDLRLFLIAATDDPDLLKRAEARFDQLGAPVDIAWTAGDRVFPDGDADRLADRFPRGRRVGDITDSGSLSPFDQPDQVAQPRARTARADRRQSSRRDPRRLPHRRSRRPSVGR